MRLPITLLAFFLPAHALAACDDPGALLRQAYPDAEMTSDGLIVAGEHPQRIKPEDLACKVWPYRPELTLLAVVLLEAEPTDEGEVHGDVEVIVADSRTGTPLARRREKGMAYGDAIQFSGVELDTARYDLTPGIRAFGVVTRQFGSSMANPYLENALWLYTFDDGRIQRVLDGLVITTVNAENDGNCGGTGAEVKRTVGMAATEHNHFRDLIVDQIDTTSVSTNENDDCKSTETSRRASQVTLQFDGSHYRSMVSPEVGSLFSYIEIGKVP